MVRLLIELIGFSLYHWLLFNTTRTERVNREKSSIHWISIVVPALSSDTHKWTNKKRPTPLLPPSPPPPLSLARTIVRLLFIVCVCNIFFLFGFVSACRCCALYILNARYDGDSIVFTYSNAYRSFACSVNGPR